MKPIAIIPNMSDCSIKVDNSENNLDSVKINPFLESEVNIPMADFVIDITNSDYFS